METETILYAVKIGNDDWQEEIITTQGARPGVLAKARAWAESQGYDRFRVWTFDGSAPDFSNVVR